METQALRAQRILSIDGGGIRGVVPSLWLEHLEQGLAAHHAGPVAEQFDLLVGNSTGALVVAGLAAGKRPAGLARLYEEARSEEHTSELQSLMRTSYAVFCLKKKQQQREQTQSYN